MRKIYSPFEGNAGFLLRRASRVQHARLTQQLSPLELSVTEASIIAVIGRNPCVSQVECGRALGVQRTNINPIIQRMIQNNLISIPRKRGRTQNLQLTDAGLNLHETVDIVLGRHHVDIFDETEEELKIIIIDFLRSLGDFVFDGN